MLDGAPFLMPVVVAVLGLLTVWGRSGWVNAGFAALGLPGFSVYGLRGVVLAHVFLNLPLATRMLLIGWQAIPAVRNGCVAVLREPYLTLPGPRMGLAAKLLLTTLHPELKN